MPVRKCTLEDLDWLLESAAKGFGIHMRDADAARSWTEKALSSPKALFLRTEKSFLVAVSGTSFFDPQTPKVIIEFFAGKRPEIDDMFLEVREWAKSHGASKIYFQPRTGYNAANLAESVGAKSDFPAFVWSI